MSDAKSVKEPGDAGLAFLITVALVLYGAFVSGLAMMLLWRWFIVPMGPPEITLIQGIGLRLLAGYAHLPWAATETQFTPFQRVVLPWMVLGLGWLIHLFM